MPVFKPDFAVSVAGSSVVPSQLVFSNNGGVSFGLSGSTLSAVAPAAGGGLTNIKLSADTLSALRSDVTFSNANGVSFGLETNGAITATVRTNYQAAGAYLTTAMRSDAATLSNVKFSGGTLSARRSDITFSDGSGVSWGLETNGVLTATVKTDYQSAGAYLTTAMQSNAATLSNIKVSAGTLSANRSAISLNDSNGVSFGLETNGVITATVKTDYQTAGAYLTTAMLSNAVTLSNIKVSAGTLSANRSALTFGDGNGVSFGLETNGSVTATVRTDYQPSGAYLTTAMQSNAATISNIKLSGSGGSVLGSDFTFANSNGFTFGLDTAARQFTASYTVPAVPAQTVQTVGLYFSSNTTSSVSSGTADARSLTFVGMGVISMGYSNGSIIASVPAGGGAATSWTVSDNGTSGTVGRLAFTNINGVTLSLSSGTGGLHTIVGSHNGLTTARASTDAIGLNTALTANGVAWTVDSRGISLNVPAFLTTAALSGDSTKYAGIDGAITGGSLTVNTSGVSINLPAYLTTAALSGDSTKYAGVGGTLATVAGTDLALTVDTGGINIGYPKWITTADLSQNSSNYLATTPIKIYEPFPFAAASATSTGGFGTLHLMPLQPDYPVSFAQLNVIASGSLASTSAGNTMTLSNGGASSFVFQAGFSNTNSQFIDGYLFSKGTGGFSSNLQTYASTRNSLVTFQNHTYQLSVSNSTWTLRSSVSVVVSFPALTSGTVTSINNASTVTTWGTGYTNWTSSASVSSTTSFATAATASASVGGTWPATTAWASMKLVPLMFGTSMSAGEWWMGLNRGSATSSSSSSAGTSIGAGRSFTSSIGASALTMTGGLTYLGQTNSILNGLGFMGGGALATMAPQQGLGSFSATYDPTVTYVNNAGQPNGAIAFTQVQTNVSFFQTWMQFANYRI